ncbi:DUF262 domain-containing protein [Sphingosinithalassobacter portus]|uniref:DUF262 domain-containing protein n=1 Tax=Stakelama portus TaxID=2676234 RepID=UPI000D6E470C|nr:DUF262 domain-containing protein [Sphingosinithalassobacter portus]
MADIEIEEWNDELASEVSAEGIESLVVYSRDWTVETILSQIAQDNIDLNPKFQRRNAWTDTKRSKLIESLILNVPVPEIVLAEDQSKKNSFIVIDGKQRLMAIAGFFNSEKFSSWDKPELRGLKTRTDLNGETIESLSGKDGDSAALRSLLNSDMRCTVLTNYKSDQVLYDIFYRLNTASVPLSSQELRQVLNRGDFANYLIAITNESIPIHTVMNLTGPDQRLRDAEIILRYICFSLYGAEYTGNLSSFLDSKMKQINESWEEMEGVVEQITKGFNQATSDLIATLTAKRVGRKVTEKGWEGRFNRALFEAEVYYAARLQPEQMQTRAREFEAGFEALSKDNGQFNDSIEATTKTNEKYEIRFSLMRDLVNEVYGTEISAVPVKAKP